MTKEKRSSEYKKILKNLSKNYWAISTIVLAILLIISLFFVANGLNTTVTSEEAGQAVLAFANNQGANAELISTSDSGSLYEVILSIPGQDGTLQEIPVYVTKDGKTLVPQPISLEIKEQEETTTSTPTPTNIPKSNKPVVEAFVMSHCPYGTQIEKGLLPVINALGDKIDFELKFVYYAMHPSQGEVEEQLNQYCIQKEQNSKFNDYLTCFLEAGDGKGCLTSTKIDTTKLKTCTTATDREFKVMENLNDQSKWLSGRFPLFNIYKADNEKYKVGGSPTLVVNGVTAQAGRDSISLLNTICGAFNEAPEECNTKFEAVSPTPGFGWSTTENTNNAAACGA
jgi:type II secretory pathway pseudopilin PulG